MEVALQVRGSIAFIALALSGCHAGSPRTIDLSCDRIRFDAAQDYHRTELRHGEVVDSSLLARGRGKVVVRGYNHRDSSRLDRPFRVVLTNTSTRLQSGGDGDQPTQALEPAPGMYSLYATCVGCSRTATTTVTVVPGRVDTADVYLTRVPDNCEVEGGRRPPSVE